MLAIAVGFFVSFLLCALAFRLGPRLGYIDRPDDPDLKAHRLAAVPLGGVGLFFGVHLAMSATGAFDPWLAAGTGILAMLGLADDRFGLSPAVRLLVEAAAGVVLAWVRFDGPSAGWLIALTAALVVLTVNAVNLFDGLDGLAGTVGLVSALGVAALNASRGSDSSVGLALAASLTAFLFWNRPPARLFLGDNGAYVIGGFLVYGVVVASSEPLRIAIGIALFGVFLVDLAVTILRRMATGFPLFGRDRNHSYDRLRAHGYSVVAIAIGAGLAQVGFVVAVLVVDHWLAPPIGVLALAALGLVLAAMIARGPRTGVAS